MADLPIRDGATRASTGWRVSAPFGTVTYRSAFVTSADAEQQSPNSPRARRTTNETFNGSGYHLEHNSASGGTLAAVLVVLNLLAFALHTACELAETPAASAPARACSSTCAPAR